MYRSKCDKHLEKVKIVKDFVKKQEDYLQQFHSYDIASISVIRKKIDECKLESDNLIQEIVNKAIEFSYQTGQVQPVVNTIPNQQNNLTIKESEMDSVIEDSLSIITTHSMILNQSSLIINPIIANEESVAILKIKSLLAGFKEKLNDSLNDNSDIINEKIKSAIYKIYHPKCKKHLEKLELIEKSIKKYEDLPNSQKTEKIINHLGQRYKQIDKWELDSDDLIETITMKALELSCKTEPNLNEQNNLQVQKLMDEMVELKNMVKTNQNNVEKPLLENLTHSIIESLDDSKFEKSISSSWLQIDKFSENDAKKELEEFSENNANKEKGLKKDKWIVAVKGELKLIKMGIKTHFKEDEIKADLKYTKNGFSKIKEYFEVYNDKLMEKDNESELIGVLAQDISDFSE
jgi:hypothetical protein